MKHRSRLIERCRHLIKRRWGTQLRYILTFCIILFCINLSFSPISAGNAKEFPTSAGIGGDHITWTYDAENKTMTFTGYGETYGIGGWIEGEALKNDYGDWYALKDKVEKVVLGEGITEIHSQAFLECSNLKEVEFPSTLKKIGSRAFEGCGVETLTFPPALKKIEMGAFRACRVETLVIPSTLSEIGEDAFCSSYIRKIIIEEGIQKINSWAFSFTSIEELTLPNSLKECRSPILYCSQLKTLNLPSNMKVIEGQWFADCPNLKQVTLPNSLKRIGPEVFNDSSLENITIPKNVEILGKKGTDSSMFYMCKNLKQLVVRSKKIKKVYSSVFKYFPKKATIYVPNSKKKEYTKMFRKAKLPKKVKIKAIKDMKK